MKPNIKPGFILDSDWYILVSDSFSSWGVRSLCKDLDVVLIAGVGRSRRYPPGHDWGLALVVVAKPGAPPAKALVNFFFRDVIVLKRGVKRGTE